MFLIGASAQFIPYLLIVLVTVVIYINDSVASTFQKIPSENNITVELAEVTDLNTFQIEDTDHDTTQYLDFFSIHLAEYIRTRDVIILTNFATSSYNTILSGSLQLRAPPIIIV